MQQVISVDRKKYATGLFWQPVASGFVARNYSRNLNRAIDRRHNLFTEYRAIVGLGTRKMGHYSGMPAAAAEVMESFAEFSSFLAAFKVQNGFWLVSVRNGIILKDELFEAEETARAEFAKLANMPDWGSVFAPSTWGIPRAVERDVNDVITGNVKATLKTISRFRANFLSLVMFAAFFVGLFYFFREPVTQMLVPKPQVSGIDPVLAEEYKRKIEEKNRELDKQFDVQRAEEVVAPEPLVMPYEQLPDVVARARLCYQAIGFLMQNVTGWAQSDVQCRQTSATVTFKRGFGNLGGFYEVATELMPGAFVEEKNESEIVLTAKLPQLPLASSLEEKDVQTIVREINTAFQKLDTPVDTSIQVDTVSNETQSENINVVEVGAKSKMTPPEFMKIFDDLRGVYMTLAEWDVQTRTWNYEVIIYAK